MAIMDKQQYRACLSYRVSLLYLPLVLGSSIAVADQWYVKPLAVLEAYYDDNVRLTSRNERNTSVANVRANVKAGRRTEISDIQLGANLTSSRYFEASDLDKTDGSLNALASYDLGRSTFKLNGAFNYDSTLTSEVSTSGYVQANKRRLRFYVQPTWTYQLTPRGSVEMTLSYEDIRYEDVDVIPLYDYDYTTAGLTFIYALSERAQAFTRVTFDRYEASDVGLKSDSTGLLFGASYQLSETLSASAYAGVRQTSSEVPTWLGVQKSDSSGPLFQFELNKRFEVGGLDFSVSRSMLPSSNGELLDTTSLALSFTRPLSHKWNFRLTADAYRNRTEDDAASSSDRDYFAISPRFEFKLSQELNLGLSYRYRWQKYDLSDEAAVSNSLHLYLTYVFPQKLIGK
ncbi:hypothetical protein ThidrDRAFT_0424 [Thiorhodococcus drewsii AZ1]|uniref:PEP-CTERM system associated protein n=2 Tax=Thiorhodococcus drewsii TaxID=210408 RepID=G2DWN5_9GAMM|nr:hypothetical protein ThidrDRAFT_0424 [Thiorhodococcus drewsii AZ1]